jgi:ABC transport system ATP-binding/permease protein
LTPGGKTAYFGPPNQIGAVMGAANWADLFARVGAEPDVVNREFLARICPSGHDAVHPSPRPTLPPCPPKCHRRQVLTLLRRQLRLVVTV